MRRVREDTHGSFIEISWIERAVFLSSTFETDFPQDFFVNDLVDRDNAPDTYIRLQKLHNCI